MEVSKKNLRIGRQLKYRQHRVRSETGILLGITLNAFKGLMVSISTQILILVIA